MSVQVNGWLELALKEGGPDHVQCQSDHSLSCWFASISGCGLNRNLDTGGEGPWRKSTSRN